MKLKEMFLICYRKEEKVQGHTKDKKGHVDDNVSQVFEQIDVGQIKTGQERATSIQIRQAAHREMLVSERPIDVC
jgi:hypothetical protein